MAHGPRSGPGLSPICGQVGRGQSTHSCPTLAVVTPTVWGLVLSALEWEKSSLKVNTVLSLPSSLHFIIDAISTTSKFPVIVGDFSQLHVTYLV